MTRGIAFVDFRIGDVCWMVFKRESDGAFLYFVQAGVIEEVAAPLPGLSNSYLVRAVAAKQSKDVNPGMTLVGQEPKVPSYWVFHQTPETQVLVSLLVEETLRVAQLLRKLEAAYRGIVSLTSYEKQ